MQPEVRPEAYSPSTACAHKYKAGTLNVSNMIWVIRSRLVMGFSAGSVKITGCSSGATFNS